MLILRHNIMNPNEQYSDSSQEEMQERITSELLEMMEVIAQNAGYSRYIDQSMLVDHKSYFDICQIIFSELNIKLIKIEEYRNAEAPEKMQQLINLLSHELRVDLSQIRGDQILNYNVEHIHRFLEILYLYSNLYVQSKNTTSAVKSQTSKHNLQKGRDQNKLNSARERPNNYAINQQRERNAYDQIQYQNQHNIRPSDVQNQQSGKEHSSHPQSNNPVSGEQSSNALPQRQYKVEKDYFLKEKPKHRNPKFSAAKKRARSHKLQRANLHSQVVNTIMNQKTKMLKAASRDNRKNKMIGIELAKASYKSYLKRFTKDNMAAQNRDIFLKNKATIKPVSQQLPRKDFDNIENMFQSFTYKFRDKKAEYLRKIQQLVRKQEQDRYNHQNRIEREVTRKIEQQMEKQIAAEVNQHRVRSKMIKQNSKLLEKEAEAMKKQLKIQASQQQREMKLEKKRELQHIQNVLREDNKKVLMNLEEGGRLEQIIMKMYKIF